MEVLNKILWALLVGSLLVAAWATVTTNSQNKFVKEIGLQNISDCLSSKGIQVRYSKSTSDNCEKALTSKWGNTTLPVDFNLMENSGWYFPKEIVPVSCATRPYALANKGGCLPK